MARGDTHTPRPETRTARPPKARLAISLPMELRGLEPLTLWLQTRCSPS